MSSDQADDFDRSLLLKVDEIGDRFETAWKSGSPPRIEDFLQQLPGDINPDLLLALIELDIHFRSQQGGAPKLVHYAARFPQQAAVIRDNLVGAHEKTVVPETGDQSDSGQTAVRPLESQRESTSRHVGPFKLLEKLGEGGMGAVYVADQLEPIKRRVALKLIRTGMDNDQMIARFEAERQALAMMDHPHIARVLDAGVTADGQPYFAMELVPGISITKYCDRNRLGISERLRLFVQVCRAIQHAHQKGILHRDLKPANVLVTQRDGVPMVKVIDFGLAKALQPEQRLTDKTLYTQMGLMVGTLEYMSPEQAEMNELGVDTRTDVYSLGVLFYELLTGSTPLGHDRVRREAYHRLVELICSEETPAPSCRLSDSGEEITGISAQRRIDPRRMQLILKGELDWIALKALAKERDRRYDGAGNLADDVEHFLDGEVVTARPPTTGYRLRKAIRRNKVAFVSGLVLVVSLLVGLIGTGTMWRRAQRAAERANTAESTAQTEAATARAAEATAQTLAVKARTAEATAETETVKARAAEASAVAARGTAERNLSAAEKNAYIFDMLLAHRDWEDAKIGHLKERLDRYRDRTDLKGFEWDYWNRLAHSALSTLRGHTAEVSSVRFSPDGKRIVSGSFDNTVKVWDAASGQETLTLKGHIGRVDSVSFSPDGTRIVSGSIDKTVKVWDAASGQETLTLQGHTGRVYSVSFSPDGTRIVSGGDGYDQMVKVWDASSGRATLTLKGHIKRGVYSVDFSPDGKWLVSGGDDQTVKVWDVASGQETLTLEGHTALVSSVSFSSDGTQIVSGGEDTRVKVWDVFSGRETLTLKGHLGPTNSVRFSPDGKRIVSSSHDGTLKLWDAETGQSTLTLTGHANQVTSVSFSRDGKRAVSGSYDQTVKLWDASTGRETLTLKGHTDLVLSVRFSPDGERVVSGSNDKTVKVWDAFGGQETLTLKGHTLPVYSVDFSPDGKWIVSGSNDKTVKVWDAASGRETLTLKGHTAEVSSVRFSPDGKRIISGGVNTVRVWDAVTGQETLTLKGHTGGVTSVRFSADGTRIVSGSVDKTVKVWDAVTGQETLTLKGHSKPVQCVDFSPDGKRIVSSSNDNTVKVWDAFSGQETLTLKGHTGGVTSVGFSADGTQIVSGSSDSTVKVWDARPRPVE